jgi:hypothetical protein
MTNVCYRYLLVAISYEMVYGGLTENFIKMSFNR